MPRLIDAEKLIDALDANIPYYVGGEGVGLVKAIQIVAKSPEVDAIPLNYIWDKIEWFREAYEQDQGRWYKNCADALTELLEDWDNDKAFWSDKDE